MKRVVKWFDHHQGCEGVARDINIYAAENNLSIINVAPCHFWGVYVLFEEKNRTRGEWIRIGQDSSRCSLCGKEHTGGMSIAYFCPNCGSRMKGGAE